MGDPDQPHSYSYTPDVAAGLITLGTAAGTTGQIWHLPVAGGPHHPAARRGGVPARRAPPRLIAAGRTTLLAIGIFQPAMREYRHTLYQFTAPWVVDDSKFRTAFGAQLHTARRRPRRHPRLVPRPHRRPRPLTRTRPDPGALMPNRTADRHRPPRRAALALPSILAIAGFTALGSVFAYPQILHEPTGDILALFRAAPERGDELVRRPHRRRRTDGPRRHLARPAGRRHPRPRIAAAGIAAAVVQVVGLQRWLTLVPGHQPGRARSQPTRPRRAAVRLWHTVLGTGIGETARLHPYRPFTVLVVIALRRSVLPRWLAVIGLVAAALIATGVVVPLVPAASLTNFAGYILWCAGCSPSPSRFSGSNQPSPPGRLTRPLHPNVATPPPVPTDRKPP